MEEAAYLYVSTILSWAIGSIWPFDWKFQTRWFPRSIRKHIESLRHETVVEHRYDPPCRCFSLDVSILFSFSVTIDGMSHFCRLRKSFIIFPGFFFNMAVGWNGQKGSVYYTISHVVSSIKCWFHKNQTNFRSDSLNNKEVGWFSPETRVVKKDIIRGVENLCTVSNYR